MKVGIGHRHNSVSHLRYVIYLSKSSGRSIISNACDYALGYISNVINHADGVCHSTQEVRIVESCFSRASVITRKSM